MKLENRRDDETFRNLSFPLAGWSSGGG